MNRRTTAVSVLALLAGTAAAEAQVITVDTLFDDLDFAGARAIPDLPGPDGRISFREAIYAADNTPGPQTIHFAIPRSEWPNESRAMLELEVATFVLQDDGTFIDFTTQTDFTGDTNPDGWEVGIYGYQVNGWGAPAISIYGDNCTIKGLDRVSLRGYGIFISGNNNRVIGCTLSGGIHAAISISGLSGGPLPTGNIIGGTGPGEGNFIGGTVGIRIDAPADNNVVIGNYITGGDWSIQVRGNQYTGPPVGNRIGGPTPAERNIIAGAGHYGEEGFPTGGQVLIMGARDTLVEGNYVGTTADGMSRVQQIGPVGIELRDAVDTTVRNNLISGIRVAGGNHYQGAVFGEAIRVTTYNAPGSGAVIEGNLIGTDATGAGAIPNIYGINVYPFSLRDPLTDTRIGGTAAGQANLIAFNERAGVRTGFATGVTISANSIHDNGALGIDRDGTGVTVNDTGEADGVQNFPVLSSADTAGMATTVSGTLESAPARTFRIEFFASSACDPSGFGEGADFLGSAAVSTDAAGFAAFSETVAPAAPGEAVTATATDLVTGETSEFSACVLATGAIPLCAADMDGDNAADVFDLLAYLDAWFAAAPAADRNRDGAADVFDLLAYLDEWFAGC